MNFESLDRAVDQSISLLKASEFYTQIGLGKNVKELYAKYLEYAYHYVRLTSSFTPLAAQRMDQKYVATRKWILEHSSEEIGHENMALHDLVTLGRDKNAIRSGTIPTGVVAWVSFFHYKVTVDNPFCAFGVLYFLEGMAKQLAPGLLPQIVGSLTGKEKTAISFFREHGDLDEGHVAEQREILSKTALTEADHVAIETTILQAGKIKRFMLDDICLEIRGIR